MARRLHGSLPGISIPSAVIDELDQASDPIQTGLDIASRLIRDLRGICEGVHIMTLGHNRHIPQILQRAGLVEAGPR
jgi:5,10-methylenetetrahydrofolate reductase